MLLIRKVVVVYTIVQRLVATLKDCRRAFWVRWEKAQPSTASSAGECTVGYSANFLRMERNFIIIMTHSEQLLLMEFFHS